MIQEINQKAAKKGKERPEKRSHNQTQALNTHLHVRTLVHKSLNQTFLINRIGTHHRHHGCDGSHDPIRFSVNRNCATKINSIDSIHLVRVRSGINCPVLCQTLPFHVRSTTTIDELAINQNSCTFKLTLVI